MIITIGEHKYSVRTKATYQAKEARNNILRRYIRKYAPSGYFLPDGSIASVQTEEIVRETNDQEKEKGLGDFIFKSVPRQLEQHEIQTMTQRALSDAEYLSEIIDFHNSPIGNAPLLSQYLEEYEPSEEEEIKIKDSEGFFYLNAVEKSLKKQQSSNDTDIPQQEEVTIQENT